MKTRFTKQERRAHKAKTRTTPKDESITGNENPVITVIAFYGRAVLTPAIHTVPLAHSADVCRVEHVYTKTLVFPKSNIEYDVSDCCIFTITHPLHADNSPKTKAEVEVFVEEALLAVNTMLQWEKATDQAHTQSNFMRTTIGRNDIKLVSVKRADGEICIGQNPLWALNHGALMTMSNAMRGFFGKPMLMSNGVAAQPLHPIVHRCYSALDLFNLGLYTEAFIVMFALLDDLIQQTLLAGISNRGISDTRRQETILRAIKDNRLQHYVTSLTKLCGWESLEEAEPEVFKKLMEANGRRNRIMHRASMLSRNEAQRDLNTIIDTIEWLQKNPFGHFVPKLPDFYVADFSYQLNPSEPIAPPAEASDPEKTADQPARDA